MLLCLLEQQVNNLQCSQTDECYRTKLNLCYYRNTQNKLIHFIEYKE